MLVKKRHRSACARAEVPRYAPRQPEGGYDLPFWLAFVSNVLASAAVAILFRYADFVQVLHGSELDLGLIVGIGMIGSLAMRFLMGASIDRYGARLVWLVSLAVLAASCLAHLAVARCGGVAVYALRILYCSALAGFYGASFTFVSRRVPVVRMAELYGMLGTATSVGYLGGVPLSDLLFGAGPIARLQVDRMFLAAALLAALAFPFAWVASRAEVRPSRVTAQSSWQILRRYSSGVLLGTSAIMGLVVGIPNAFLRTYAAELGWPRIGLFFSVCSLSLVLTRVPTRRWPELLGHRRVILMGLGLLTVSQLAYLGVSAEWQLALPALAFGASQAILFPAITGLGSALFPEENRGLATTLMLAATDVGVLVGLPAAGAIVRYSGLWHLPPYPTLFAVLALLLTATAAWYAWADPRSGDGGRPREDSRKGPVHGKKSPGGAPVNSQGREPLVSGPRCSP